LKIIAFSNWFYPFIVSNPLNLSLIFMADVRTGGD
jgi:hypothetical protein